MHDRKKVIRETQTSHTSHTICTHLSRINGLISGPCVDMANYHEHDTAATSA